MQKVHITLPTQDNTPDALVDGRGNSQVVTATSQISWHERLLKKFRQRLGKNPQADSNSRRNAWASGASWELNFWEEFLAERQQPGILTQYRPGWGVFQLLDDFCRCTEFFPEVLIT